MRNLFLASLLLLLPAAGPLCAQGANDGDPRYKSLRRELLKMEEEDQRHRTELYELMKKLAEPGGQRLMNEYVAFVKKEGKKQIYGTAMHTDAVTKGLQLWPIENEEEVDARRASVGLPPMAEFFKVMGMTYTPPKKSN